MNKEPVIVPIAPDADFCFINTGDSMINARIFDGDLVYVKQQSTVENGDIAVFSLDGETRIGRFYRGSNYISFKPDNSLYDTIFLRDEEIDRVQIYGKAVAFLSSIPRSNNPCEQAAV